MKLLKKIGLALSLMLVLVPCLNVQAKDITDNPDVGDITILPEEDLTKVPDNGLGSISVELTDPYDKYLSKENVKFGVVQIADIEKGEYILKESFADVDIPLAIVIAVSPWRGGPSCALLCFGFIGFRCFFV